LLFSNNSSVNRALPQIHSDVSKRIQAFAHNVDCHHHVAFCYVPLVIAQVLHQRPELVADAVKAFYYRDPDSLRACSRMEKFTPKDNVFVRVGVKFSRCLYGQLHQQHFVAPRRRGTVSESMDWFPVFDIRHPEYKSATLGMKLV
jgi:hypothetical protein